MCCISPMDRNCNQNGAGGWDGGATGVTDEEMGIGRGEEGCVNRSVKARRQSTGNKWRMHGAALVAASEGAPARNGGAGDWRLLMRRRQLQAVGMQRGAASGRPLPRRLAIGQQGQLQWRQHGAEGASRGRAEGRSGSRHEGCGRCGRQGRPVQKRGQALALLSCSMAGNTPAMKQRWLLHKMQQHNPPPHAMQAQPRTLTPCAAAPPLPLLPSWPQLPRPGGTQLPPADPSGHAVA